MDYCNSLFYNMKESDYNRLQRIQNHAARIITLTRKYDHITPVRMALHWLPVRQRVEYKILLTTYKALNNLAPEYISTLVKPYVPARPLRSAEQYRLRPTFDYRLESYGGRAFSTAAPRLWNELDHEIKIAKNLDMFKSLLKTYLFKKAYL